MERLCDDLFRQERRMVFGRFRRDELLENQKEYLRNCIEQIEDLEGRVNEERLAALRRAYAGVWVADEEAQELLGKVKLARRFATDLGEELGKVAIGLETASPALETLQTIIDACERDVQSLIAGLMARQGLAS
jgi:hypothetical protein